MSDWIWRRVDSGDKGIGNVKGVGLVLRDDDGFEEDGIFGVL